MAACEAAEGEPGASEEAKADQGYIGVLGTGGEVETLRGTEGVEDGGEDRLVDTKGDADGEGGLRVGHLLAQAEADRGSGCLSCCLSCCLSAAFWMARKTWATSRSRVENSRSIALRRGWRITSTGRLRAEI